MEREKPSSKLPKSTAKSVVSLDYFLDSCSKNTPRRPSTFPADVSAWLCPCWRCANRSDSQAQGYEGSTPTPLPKVRMYREDAVFHNFACHIIRLESYLPSSFPLSQGWGWRTEWQGYPDSCSCEDDFAAAVLFCQVWRWPSKGPRSNCRSATAVNLAQLRIPFPSDMHFVGLRLIG